MKSCGNTPPINIKSKRSVSAFVAVSDQSLDKDQWINLERQRWAKYFSVPMTNHMPEGFPPLTLATQRVLSAISLKSPESLVPATDALYRSFWVDGNAKIGQPEGFIPVLEGLLGKNATEEILKAVRGPRSFWISKP